MDVEDAESSSSQVNQKVERGRPKLRTKTFDGSIAPESWESQDQRSYVGEDRSVPQWIQGTLPFYHLYLAGAQQFFFTQRLILILQDPKQHLP